MWLTGLTTSVIAHFILPNLKSYTQAGWVFSSRLQVIQYESSAFTITLLKYSHSLIKTIIICQTQPFTADHSHSIRQSFCEGHIIPADPLIWEEDQEKKCCPFSKCPMEKNKKALQYHSIFIHWGYQWTSDGLKPYPLTPLWLNANMYRNTSLYVRRASSTTWGLTTWRPF